MKSITSGLFFLFFSIVVYAQDTKHLPKNGETYNDPFLDQFVGEWITDGRKSEKIKFFLRKKMQTYQGNITASVLVGYHDYEKDQKKVDSSYEFKEDSKESENKISIRLTASGRPNELGGFIKEEISGKRSMILAQFDPNSKTLTVKLHETGELRFNQPKRKRSLPTEFVLRKVK